MTKNCEHWSQMTYPFENIALPYSLTALAPYIDAKTMQAHYDRLLVTYINNLNLFLDNRPELQTLTLTELIEYATLNQEIALLHSAGGVYNHFFFFDSLHPATGQIVIGITPQATAKITQAFGGWQQFKEKFAAASLSVFGSGYAWLVKNEQNQLNIVTTANQEVPLDCTPILCLDVWEHAYYLQHLNERKAYIDNFWCVVDWVKFSQRLGS